MAWLGNWKYRRKITISNTNIDSTLSNFPIFINISASSGTGTDDLTDIFDELAADANRKKIAITTDDGTTECYVEIERWNDAAEKAELWVKVPSVSDSAVTELYIYFDVLQAENTTYVGDTTDAVTHNVWDANSMAVWHMAQDPNGDGADAIKDSTASGKDATPEGTMVTADLVSGKVGLAIDFDGADDDLDIGSIGVADPLRLNGSDVTIEAIIKNESGGDTYQRIYDKSDGGGAANGYNLFLNALKLRVSVDGNTWESDDDVISYSTFHYVVGVITGSAFTLYVDGIVKPGHFTAGSASQPPDDTTNAKIGTWNHDVAREFKGIIDEMRISDTGRSADWIKATHYSNWDGLNSFSATESFLTLTEPFLVTTSVAADIVVVVPSVRLPITTSIAADIFPGKEIDCTGGFLVTNSFQADLKISLPVAFDLQTAIICDPTIAVPNCPFAVTTSGSIDISDIFSTINTVRVYICTLTGDANGVADIDIPINSFQTERVLYLQNPEFTGLPKNIYTYSSEHYREFLSVVIPGFDYITAINQRLRGLLVVKMTYKAGSEILTQEIIASVPLELIKYNESSNNKFIILEGSVSGEQKEVRLPSWVQVNPETGLPEIWYDSIIPAEIPPKRVILQNITFKYQSLVEGKLTFRCTPDLYLLPGDTAIVGEDHFPNYPEFFTTEYDRTILGSIHWKNGDLGTEFGVAHDLWLISDATGQYCKITFDDIGTNLVSGGFYRLTYDYTEYVAGFEFKINGAGLQTLGDAIEGTSQMIDFTASETFTGAHELRIYSKTNWNANGRFDNFSLKTARGIGSGGSFPVEKITFKVTPTQEIYEVG